LITNWLEYDAAEIGEEIKRARTLQVMMPFIFIPKLLFKILQLDNIQRIAVNY
jgi:hypothetical protein